MAKMRQYEVTCSIKVSEDDVWDYLEDQGEEVEQLRQEGYELDDADWKSAAEWLFNDDDFTYHDFNLTAEF